MIVKSIKSSCLIVLGSTIVLCLGIGIFIYYSASDGKTCKTESLAESQERGLFVAEYEFREWTSVGKPIRFDEIWLEHQCVYEGRTKRALDMYLLQIRVLPNTLDPQVFLVGAPGEGLGALCLTSLGDLPLFIRPSYDLLLTLGVLEVPRQDSLWLYLVQDQHHPEVVLDSILLTKKAA